MSKEVTMNPALLLKAIAFGADKRFGQRRKDAEESPYINHFIAVGTVVAVEGGVSDESILLCGHLARYRRGYKHHLRRTRTTFRP
jgi:hypothetical protein